jgi:hypothetical protein
MPLPHGSLKDLCFIIFGWNYSLADLNLHWLIELLSVRIKSQLSDGNILWLSLLKFTLADGTILWLTEISMG